ncbi:hypothetical protein CCH79_00015092 [Gambusia affinis]|uniref:Pentraxin (PTX) domain-containing protein n=1 Tax=Gambusia affinis TaxID=33528 RepID=A0A315WBW8_GAMAF|nr:hypothetical protein CCH79_00015092 [Gambusia affinis]
MIKSCVIPPRCSQRNNPTLILHRVVHDTLGGRFDASQALVGELSQFNLWDRVLKPAEVAALADCSSSALGNIAPWTDQDIDVYNGATKESLDPCHAAQRSGPKQ